MVFGHHFWLEVISPFELEHPPPPPSPPFPLPSEEHGHIWYLLFVSQDSRFPNKFLGTKPNLLGPPPLICFHTKGMSERDLRVFSRSLSFSAFGSYASEWTFIFGESHGWVPQMVRGPIITPPFFLSLHGSLGVCVSVNVTTSGERNEAYRSNLQLHLDLVCFIFVFLRVLVRGEGGGVVLP